MKMWTRRDTSVAKVLIPAVAALAVLVAMPSVAANEGIPLTPYPFGLSAYIIESIPSSPFELPDQLVTKGNFRAFDLGGQPTISIHGIRGIYSVFDAVTINGVGGQKEARACVALGFEFGTFGDTAVFSDTAAVPLAMYASGWGDATNLSAKRVPVGPKLSGPDLRPDGIWDDDVPNYSKNILSLSAVWTYGTGFTPTAVGVVTEDSAFRVIQAGDPVPDFAGETFSDFDSFTPSLSVSYVAFQGRFFSGQGLFTQRFSDGKYFQVASSLTLDPNNFGGIIGSYIHNDTDVVFGTSDGIYQGDVEGRTPAENILPNDTEYEPGKFFRSGVFSHGADDQIIIYGSGDNFLTTIFTLNLNDHSIRQVAQEGEAIPGGGTFYSVANPDVSADMAVFEGYGPSPSAQFLGLFARMLDTWELEPILRVGDIFDGREVKTVIFHPGALDGKVVGTVVNYTDGSSGAYLLTMNYDSIAPYDNLSTRLFVGGGDNAGIGGFINTLKPGPNQTVPLDVGAKQVVVRAIGPSLGALGVAGPLADPVLELRDATGALITSNDNWRDSQEQEIMDAGLAPTDDLESAILTTLEPGAYTAIVVGNNGGTGVGLVEIYDLDGAAVSELGNISTRGSVQTGDGVMIGGFIVGGTESTASSMVVRAIGPSLSAFGVADALQDPTLELHDGSGTLIASNDNWKDTQQSELEAAGLAPTDDRESAIEIALGPGLYTAIVRGVGDTTGVALVEAYNLEASAAPVAFPIGLTNRR